MGLLGIGESLAKWLQFGGSLYCIPGLDETPGSAVLAASWPLVHGNSQPGEVLVRAELGSPASSGKPNLPGMALRTGSANAHQCRVAIRSTSNSLNRALGTVILEAISSLNGSS